MNEHADLHSDPLLHRRLIDLRQEFDATFARPLRTDHALAESILCFRTDDGMFAVKLSELQLLTPAGPVVPIPSRSVALLGLCAVRARIFPVFSLGRLTGTSDHADSPHWLAVLRGTSPLAFGIHALEGYADRGSPPEPWSSGAPPFIQGSILRHSTRFALLNCADLYRTITAPASGPQKGQVERA